MKGRTGFNKTKAHLVVVYLTQLGTRVGGVGFAVRREDLTHDQHVGGAADGVMHNTHRPDDAVTVVALGLASGAAVVAPVRVGCWVHAVVGFKGLGLNHYMAWHDRKSVMVICLTPRPITWVQIQIRDVKCKPLTHLRAKLVEGEALQMQQVRML